MEPNPSSSKGEPLYQDSDSIFKSFPESRVELPGEEELPFQEVQSFDQIWIWALLGIEMLVVLVPLILTQQPFWAIFLMLSVMVMTMVILGSLKLITRMDDEGVHFQMKVFHWKVKTIPWEEIDQIFVRTYSPISEYGGWGVRYGRQGTAYNVGGKHGIQIIKKNGKKILLGTQKPEEAAGYLSRHPLLV